MEPVIIIPCKSFAVGKSRLSAVLSPESRNALCRSFLVNTVAVAHKLAASDHIRIVSSDSDVASVASQLGVNCDGENDRDLNSALTSSVAKIVAGGLESRGRNILILPIDLTLNMPAAIAPVIAARANIVIVPDRLDQGTNVLRLDGNVARNFRFQYGENSFSKHRAEAQRLGLTVEILRDPMLCFDVDTPADYVAWASEISYSFTFI
jgi:2-phospho-L-lactate/phosphoenolpyruvate guanylyltransferase